jgi:hypothetical protein
MQTRDELGQGLTSFEDFTSGEKPPLSNFVFGHATRQNEFLGDHAEIFIPR